MNKICPICGECFEDFSKNKAKETCSNHCRHILYLSKTPDKRFNDNLRQRINVLKRGGVLLTEDDYQSLVEGLKEGVCRLCGKQVSIFRNLHIDHDHKTKRYRGILCNKCNLLLGVAEDDSFKLRLAADYLEYYGQ